MKRLIVILLSILTIISSFTGCSSNRIYIVTETDYTLSAVRSNAVTSHAWTYLSGLGREPGKYAAYTYVLVGRTNLDSESVRKFHSLVGVIKSNTSGTSSFYDEKSSSKTNLFLIPWDGGGRTPDVDLAKAYASALEASDGKFQNPGPFLVTLIEPISSETRFKNLLFVDLSGVHEAAFSEVVSALKSRIINDRITGINTLVSFKASLLSLAFITEDSVKFAVTALAELQNVFKEQ